MVRGALRVDCREKYPKLPRLPREHIGGRRPTSQSRRATVQLSGKLSDIPVLSDCLTWLRSAISPIQILRDQWRFAASKYKLAEVDSGDSSGSKLPEISMLVIRISEICAAHHIPDPQVIFYFTALFNNWGLDVQQQRDD
jgi:hypothetical protein